MKRGIIVIALMFFIIPFVYSQTLTINDMFDSRILSYSSDKVMVSEEGVFKVEGESTPSIVSTSPPSAFYYVGNNLVATSTPNGVEYYYLDRIGSDISSKSLPFGEPITINNLFSFTGKELDNEFYYFGARYYSPELGRFISVDPVEENHPYTYVNNDPMNLIDPDGKEIVRYQWTAPTSGSPVDHYIMEGRFGGGVWSALGTTPTEDYTFDIPDPLLATGFELKVAGVDKGVDLIAGTGDERQGPWSEASDVYYGGGVVSGVGDSSGANNPLPTPYPNPASDRSTIRYYVPEGSASDFKLEIFNVKGQRVREVQVDGWNRGYSEFQWDLKDQSGRDVASGAYFVKYSFKYEFTSTVRDKEGEEIVTRHVARPRYDTRIMVVK